MKKLLAWLQLATILMSTMLTPLPTLALDEFGVDLGDPSPSGHYHIPMDIIPGTMFAGGGWIVDGSKQVRKGELTVTFPETIPYAHPIGSFYSQAAISETGNLYVFGDNGSLTGPYPLLPPPEGQLWKRTDITMRPLSVLGVYPTPAVVRLGSTLLKIETSKYQTTKWAENAVDFVTVGDKTFYLSHNSGTWRLHGLDKNGQEYMNVASAGILPAWSSDWKRLYYVSAGGHAVKSVNLHTGTPLDWSLALESPAVNLDFHYGTLLVVFGESAFEYDLETNQQTYSYQFPGPGEVSYCSPNDDAIRYVGQGEIREYGDGLLTWQTELPPDAAGELVPYGVSYAISLEGDRLLPIASTDWLDRVKLYYGYGIVHKFKARGDEFVVDFDVHSAPAHVDLAYTLFISDGPDPLNPRVAASGVVRPDDEPVTVTGLSFGTDAQLVVMPVQLTKFPAPPISELQSEPVVYTFGTLGGMHVNSTPATIKLESPAEHEYHLWGDETAVPVTMLTNKQYSTGLHGTPIYIYSPWGVDTDTYLDHVFQLKGDALINPLVILAGANPVWDPEPQDTQVFASITVYKHWMDTRPGTRVHSTNGFAFKVPDAALVDMENSSVFVGEQELELKAGADGKSLIAVPSSPLPLGATRAAIALVKKAEGELELLDTFTWDVTVAESRLAELWINKKVGYIDNVAYTLEAAPAILSNRTMVPIRFIGDSMGASLAWNNSTKQATFKLEDKTVVLKIGSRQAMVDGKPVLLEVAPRIISGRTMVPLRFVSENLGAGVHWSSLERKITITTK